ncbi:MAG: DNA-3-methyladenine glycosylase I [Candidatus Azotimanducaceae bacterium]
MRKYTLSFYERSLGLPKQIDQRCDWCQGDPLYEAYHDEEWGVPLRDDQKLFEFMILEGAQAGLSWITVLRKRENYRHAFWDFNPEKIATFDKRAKHKLLNNEGIIRNRLKIDSAVNNAQRFLEVQSKGSFSQFLWQFVDGQPIQNQYESMSDVPATTDRSDLMAKTLKKAGFNFVGSTICYALMQATGMVNDHLVTCPRHKPCKALA